MTTLTFCARFLFWQIREALKKNRCVTWIVLFSLLFHFLYQDFFISLSPFTSSEFVQPVWETNWGFPHSRRLGKRHVEFPPHLRGRAPDDHLLSADYRTRPDLGFSLKFEDRDLNPRNIIYHCFTDWDLQGQRFPVAKPQEFSTVAVP